MKRGNGGGVRMKGETNGYQLSLLCVNHHFRFNFLQEKCYSHSQCCDHHHDLHFQTLILIHFQFLLQTRTLHHNPIHLPDRSEIYLNLNLNHNPIHLQELIPTPNCSSSFDHDQNRYPQQQQLHLLGF